LQPITAEFFMAGLLRDVAATLRGYFAAQLTVAAILTGIYAAGFAIAGVPLWLLVAVFGGFMQFIPVVGGVVTLLVAALSVAFAGGDIYNYLGVLITFVVAQGLEGFYLTPKITGRHTKLSPWAVFFGLLLGGMLFGPAGLLLVVPVMAVAAVFWRRLQFADRRQ
jgi:predicted PurR-regulated permease PerM